MPRAAKKTQKKSSKVTFQKEFYSDLTVDDMLFAVTVRSPVAEGIITAINHPNFPEGYTLVTARDVPGINLIDTQHGKIPIFSEGNISYLGEPAALLVGPDEDELKKLLGELQISIDNNSLEAYLTDGGEEFFSDTLAERTLECDEKKIKETFDKAEHVIDCTWNYSLNTPNYSEPNGALCFWKDSNLTVFTPTQWLNNLRHIISNALNIKTDEITIEKTTTLNRGTNSIWYNSIIACQVAVASKKCGKPVKLVYSREEQEKFLDTMQSISIRNKTAADKDGKILAMDIEIDVDAGFENPFAQETIDRLVIASYGCYNPKILKVHAVAKKTLHPASSTDIQLIDSASFFAIENQMNELSKKCNLTPLEIRLNNIVELEQKKKKDSTKSNLPFKIEIEKFSETMNALVKISDFNRKYASYNLDSMDWKKENGPKEYASIFSSPMRGVGFACAYEGSGYYGSEVYGSDQTLEITMESPNTITIHCPPISQSINEIWSKMASEILDIPVAYVKINSEFKNGEEPPLPENVYSNISVMTQLLKKSCQALKKVKPGQEFPYTVKRKITLAQKSEWDKEKFMGKPFHSTSFIAAIIEVEINPGTYREEIRNIYLMINGGKIMNPMAANSTIKLSVEKVLSSLVEGERIKCPNLQIRFVQSDSNPTQIGELVYQVIPSAFTQALTQALNCTISSLPLKIDSLYKDIKENKRRIEKIEAERKRQEEEIRKQEAENQQEDKNTETEEIKEDENSSDSKQ